MLPFRLDADAQDLLTDDLRLVDSLAVFEFLDPFGIMPQQVSEHEVVVLA